MRPPNKILTFIFKMVFTGAVFSITILDVTYTYHNVFNRIKGRFHVQEIFPLNTQKIKLYSQFFTLDRMLPDFKHLVAISDNKTVPDKIKLSKCIKYYNQIKEYFPQYQETYALLGFCYYHAGRIQDAIEQYQKAISLNPNFFNPWYDLGTIYFQQHQFDMATLCFVKALNTSPELTMQTILSSKLYQQFIPSGFNPVENLKTSYAHIAYMLKQGLETLSAEQIDLKL